MPAHCNRKSCRRPRWRGHLNCRYHVLRARDYERLRRRRILLSPARRLSYLAWKYHLNRIFQRKRRDKLNPRRRKVQCGLCHKRGHNLRSCPKSLKLALEAVLLALRRPRARR